MFKIIDQWGNTKQNHVKMSLHSYGNGLAKKRKEGKERKKKELIMTSVGRIWRNWKTLLVKMLNGLSVPTLVAMAVSVPCKCRILPVSSWMGTCPVNALSATLHQGQHVHPDEHDQDWQGDRQVQRPIYNQHYLWVHLQDEWVRWPHP